MRVYNHPVAALLLFAGCAGTPHRPGARAFEARSTDVVGTLVEARHYFETGAVGDDHTFCAYVSALGESPVAVLTEDGALIMLTSRPSHLALYVSRTVRIEGKLTANGQLLVPSSLRLREGSNWVAAEL